MPTHRQTAQVLLLNGSQILLCFHKAGNFRGLFTGLITECADGETPGDAAVRGLAAAGLTMDDSAALQLRAVLDMVECNEVQTEHEFVYSGRLKGLTSKGVPKVTPKVAWEWFNVDDIPFADMPEDDALWYPPVLSGQKLKGRFEFSDEGMVSQSFSVVDSL